MCVLIRPDGVDHHAYTIAINLVKLSNTYTAILGPMLVPIYKSAALWWALYGPCATEGPLKL